MTKSTLFIDESGKSSLADQNNRPFLLTGVILDNQEIQTVEGYFNYIKLKFGLSTNTPFHSYEIFEKPDSKLADSELIKLSKNIAEFLSLIPATIYLVETDKKMFMNALGAKSVSVFKGRSERKEMKDYPYRVSATYIFSRFGQYLNNKSAFGEIIADSRKGGDHQLLKTLDLCKENVIPIKKEYQAAINNNILAIGFAEKSFLSGGLEITDVISYVSFNKSIRNNAMMAKVGLNYIWKEIKIKSKYVVVNKDAVRIFFRLRKNEVHKYLK